MYLMFSPAHSCFSPSFRLTPVFFSFLRLTPASLLFSVSLLLLHFSPSHSCFFTFLRLTPASLLLSVSLLCLSFSPSHSCFFTFLRLTPASFLLSDSLLCFSLPVPLSFLFFLPYFRVLLASNSVICRQRRNVYRRECTDLIG